MRESECLVVPRKRANCRRQEPVEGRGHRAKKTTGEKDATDTGP